MGNNLIIWLKKAKNKDYYLDYNMTKQQKLIVFSWKIFQPTRYKIYEKWIKQGMSERSAFTTAKLK